MFMNIFLEDAVEEKDGGEKARLGTVVSKLYRAVVEHC
jgi:small nuclear ribonucleoprotein (snRNP)-like protein